MKTVGRVPNDGKFLQGEEGYLVSLTAAEHYALCRLQEVCKTNGTPWRPDHTLEGTDFSGLFGAIEAFCQAKFHVDNLKTIAAKFEKMNPQTSASWTRVSSHKWEKQL